MKLLIIFVCVIAITCAKKPGKPEKPDKIKGKTEKKVFDLCSAYNASYVTVVDPAFDEIFSEEVMGEFCNDLFDEMNKTAKPVFRELDGIKTLGKVCKSYEKQYPEDPMEGPLVGFGEICNATYEARAMSLNDKKSQKSLKDIKKMCVAQDDGTLWIKISNYTEVFEDLEDFCDVFMNDTTLIQSKPKKRGDKVDGVRMLGGVCRWYSKKYEMYAAEGTMAELEPICDDYTEVKTALEEEEEEEEEEEDDDDDLPE